MFEGRSFAATLKNLGVTHVPTVPDTTTGAWLPDIRAAGIHVVQVCREGEAWGIAAGLYLGGASPLVLIQCTGFFESGDALRNTVHDFRLPLYAMVGYRSYLNQEALPGDTCLKFTEPVVQAWQIDTCFVREPAQLNEVAQHYRTCRDVGRPGIALFAEGRA